MNHLKSRQTVGVLTVSLGLALLFSTAGPALAHVGYTTLDTTNGVVSSVDRTASSNAGWLAGQDATTWANSHDNRFFSFNLADTMTIDFTMTGTNTNTNGILNPGYSIFAGTVPGGSHDGAGNLPAGAAVPLSYVAAQTGFATWSPFAATNDEIASNNPAGLTTAHWGTYRSNADVTMANNGLPLAVPVVPGVASTMTYTGLSGFNASGNSVTGHYTLGPGLYSLVVGGANPFDLATYLADAIATNGDYTNPSAALTAYNADRLARTFNLQFSAVPIPAAVYLFGSGLIGLVGLARRKMSRTA
jgi:hypothetical protein